MSAVTVPGFSVPSPAASRRRLLGRRGSPRFCSSCARPQPAAWRSCGCSQAPAGASCPPRRGSRLSPPVAGRRGYPPACAVPPRRRSPGESRGCFMPPRHPPRGMTSRLYSWHWGLRTRLVSLREAVTTRRGWCVAASESGPWLRTPALPWASCFASSCFLSEFSGLSLLRGLSDGRAKACVTGPGRSVAGLPSAVSRCLSLRRLRQPRPWGRRVGEAGHVAPQPRVCLRAGGGADPPSPARSHHPSPGRPSC